MKSPAKSESGKTNWMVKFIAKSKMGEGGQLTFVVIEVVAEGEPLEGGR